MSSAGPKTSAQLLAEKMDPAVVTEISAIVGQLTGVQLGTRQTAMVQSRLIKRMRELNILNSADYLTYIKANFKSESQILISLLTTHHTFFFREFFHFEFLLKEGLPRVIEDARKRGQNKLRIWSAACSHGQESYSLSMFLQYHLRVLAPGMTYEIFGSDVDPDSVKVSRNAVYRYDQIKEIPTMYVANHWQRGSGDIAEFVKAKDSIKAPCSFDVMNLFELAPMKQQMFDIIFCRNVFIYFNSDQIKTITTNLLNHLHPNGYLFLGLSETLNGLKLPVKQQGPSVYCRETASQLSVVPKIAGAPAPSPSAARKPNAPAPVAAAKTTPAPAALTRVLCVDDSPVVLTLLKKVLTAEHGFEVVATAADGLLAREEMQKHRVDIVTLDIHMPNQNGIEYLRNNFNAAHPPVIMISSASREDAQFGVKSLELGAVDFIEKPTLANLSEKADEIRLKMKCAVDFYKESKKAQSTNLEASFNFSVEKVKTEKALRVMVGGLGDMQKIKTMIAAVKGDQPPLLLFLHGAENFFNYLPEQLNKSGRNVKILENTTTTLNANDIYLVPFNKFKDFQTAYMTKLKTHMLILGEPDVKVARELVQVTGCYTLLEESANAKPSPGYQSLKPLVSECLPYTSMMYHSDRSFLVKGEANGK